MSEERWIIVCKAAGIVNAHIILGRLQTDGIPACLQYEAIGVISLSLDVDGLGEVDVCVPESFVDQAKEILAQNFNDIDLKYE
jgi:hypothetical protein